MNFRPVLIRFEQSEVSATLQDFFGVTLLEIRMLFNKRVGGLRSVAPVQGRGASQLSPGRSAEVWQNCVCRTSLRDYTL